MFTLNHIIWDWNGTLLDDIDLCIVTINKMLSKRKLPQLTKETYREIFTFPVKKYYEKAGFDFTTEDWNIAAHEFIYEYLAEVNNCKLTPWAKELLSFFKLQGYKQTIISAMEHDELVKSVDHLNISTYFNHIGGINNHLASSKVENAMKYFSENAINPRQALLIGDTLHDAEVANELGCNCILVASGHQSYTRLLSSGCEVIKSLEEITRMFKNDIRQMA